MPLHLLSAAFDLGFPAHASVRADSEGKDLPTCFEDFATACREQNKRQIDKLKQERIPGIGALVFDALHAVK